MKQLLIICAAVALLLSCMSSGSSDPNATTAEDFSDYASWQKANAETITGDPSGVLGNAHEGASGLREIYVNSVGAAMFAANERGPYPVGTIVLKESFKSDSGAKGSLTGITVMVKREAGYDSENGDWEYLNVNSKMKIKAQGKMSMCISCHSASEDDYLFSNMD